MAAPSPDPLWAVLSPPRAERFRARVGLGADEPLHPDFAGWSKLVFLSADRAFLFPRHEGLVDAFWHEIDALRSVESAPGDLIPRVLEVWDDRDLSPHPIAAITRLPGTVLEALLPGLDATTLGRLFEQLGTAAARWHTLDPGTAADRPPRELPYGRGLVPLLDRSVDAAHAASELTTSLPLDSGDAARAAAAIRQARTLELGLLHGDLHEGQLLVDPAATHTLTGVLDWQTALVAHPFTEFDLGQWGPTIWRRHRASFPLFRRRYWDAYAEARGLPDDLGTVFDWCWAIAHALDLTEAAPGTRDPGVFGTADEARAAAVAITRALPN